MGDLHAFDLILFVAATFAAAFVAGLAGFAFGIVAAGVWLHFLSPAETAALIVALINWEVCNLMMYGFRLRIRRTFIDYCGRPMSRALGKVLERLNAKRGARAGKTL